MWTAVSMCLNSKKYLLPSLKIPRCSPPGSVLWKFTDFTGKQIHTKKELHYYWTLKTQILAGGLCQRHPCKCVLLKRCSKICCKIYRKSTVSESCLKRDSRRGVFLWFLEKFSGQIFGEALLLLFLSTFYFSHDFSFKRLCYDVNLSWQKKCSSSSRLTIKSSFTFLLIWH